MTPQPLNYDRAEAQLFLHEGFEPRPFRCTEKKLTVGCGYNIDARGLEPLSRALGRSVTLKELHERGLDEREARTVLREDIRLFEAAIIAGFPVYNRLDEVRKRVVVDFVFNVGGTGARTFKTAAARLTLAVAQTDPRMEQVCLEATGYHVMDSLWADQVDDGLRGRYGRADRVVTMLVTGKDYTR